MEKHIQFIDYLIQKELESFPRAIQGLAPMEVLKEKADKVDMLREIRSQLEGEPQEPNTRNALIAYYLKLLQNDLSESRTEAILDNLRFKLREIKDESTI